ncbi:CoA-binding protein [Marivirga arenosa]|uniref:CoA-binding protein n=1 Tax=Marivirga arenosa TaxID=3059076 RepID=A0AA49JCK8_9BACT|nr:MULTISPECIES: CoA-binding protein [unclassified Marivirga]WKK79687.1 CoA-binding protein [Marivirga sp. BKB1-2]WMN06321.1 CoA-binding protein [Marivirga sp. ABR2-2]
MSKKTVIIGATPNPSRYAYFAADRLSNAGHEFVPVGIKKGEVFGEEIQDIRKSPEVKDVDTITLYLGARHQPEYYDYLLSLNPKRIIFNPGTENPELSKMAQEKGIETENACTLVMLGSGIY